MTTTHTLTPTGTGRTADPVLSVRDLNVRFPTEAGTVHAVRGVSFDLYPGQVLGIVGESGSGKSVTSLAVMGLLSESDQVGGEVTLAGESLLGLSDKEMSRLRGNSISMVFQDPLSSLTPVLPMGQQVAAAIKNHNPRLPKAEREARALDRKSTRLNSSHVAISYAVFCLKKKITKYKGIRSYDR